MIHELDLKNFPKGWTISRVGDHIERLTNGLTIHQEKQPPGIPVSRIETISDGTINFERVHYVRSISEEKKENFLLKFGDILFSHINSNLHLGKTSIYFSNKPLLHGMNLLLLRTNKMTLDPYYLHYLFGYYRHCGKFIKIAQHAVNQSSLNQQKINSLLIPIAPLEQQRVIVSEIEKQFSRLDEAVAGLKRAKANLKRYKAAILKAAVEGRLTEQWRKEHPDVEPAEKLLQRILAERRAKWEQAELAKMNAKNQEHNDSKWKQKYKEPIGPDQTNLTSLRNGWTWCTSDQIFWFVTSGSRGWAKYYSNEGPVFLRIGNLDHNSIELDLKNIQHVQPPKGAEGVRTQVEANDLLISITADVGMVAVIPQKFEEAYINQHIALSRPGHLVDSFYLGYFLTSKSGQNQFQKFQRGATKVGLGLDDIKGVNIALPPLKEQKEIVLLINQRLNIIGEIEKSIDLNLRRSERLRQSILKKAFSGQLIETKEGSDLSGAALA
jgi:type I restriction enzyme S subunit